MCQVQASSGDALELYTTNQSINDDSSVLVSEPTTAVENSNANISDVRTNYETFFSELCTDRQSDNGLHPETEIAPDIWDKNQPKRM